MTSKGKGSNGGNGEIQRRVEDLKADLVAVAPMLYAVELRRKQEDVATLSAKADGLVVQDEAGEKTATDLALGLKGIADGLDENRKSIKEPGLRWGKLVDSLFNPTIKAAIEAVDGLREKVAAHRQRLFQAEQKRQEELRREAERVRLEAEERERKAREEAERAAAEAERLRHAGRDKQAAALEKKAEMQKAQADAAAQTALDAQERELRAQEVRRPAGTVTASGGRAETKMVWEFEIMNREMIPMEYWEINQDMIKSVGMAGVKGTGKPTEIPGVRWFQRPQVAFGG